MEIPFTEIEKRMLAVLGDGLPHTKQDLHACLKDELGPLSNIHPHLRNIRKKLPPGTEIICQLIGKKGKSHAFRLIRGIKLIPEEPLFRQVKTTSA